MFSLQCRELIFIFAFATAGVVPSGGPNISRYIVQFIHSVGPFRLTEIFYISEKIIIGV